VVEEISEQNFKSVMDTSCFVALNMARAVLPSMRKHRRGTIIMMSSLSALLGLPCDSAYAASKAALERVSESLYLEVMRLGIQVKIIQPGSFNTQLASKALTSAAGDFADYRELSKCIASRNTESQGEADDPMLLVKEVIGITQTNVKQLYFPIGLQAQHVVARLNAAKGMPREELLLELSGLEWWLSS
jgi:short-subunit dehydrogenase